MTSIAFGFLFLLRGKITRVGVSEGLHRSKTEIVINLEV